jgi:hypothetical protein
MFTMRITSSMVTRPSLLQSPEQERRVVGVRVAVLVGDGATRVPLGVGVRVNVEVGVGVNVRVGE